MQIFRPKLFIIYNPVAGSFNRDKFEKRLDRYVLDNKDDTILFRTEYPGHAAELAAKALEINADTVIVAGGDGTVNEVAGVLVNSNTKLLIIPTGSGNGLARHLKLPLNIEGSIKLIECGKDLSIDCGMANDMYFFCTCGVGYDAEVSKSVSLMKKRGRMMYAREMIKVFLKYKPERLKLISDQEEFEEEVFTLTFANANQYGNNAYIAPDADIQDGKIDIAIIKPISLLKVLLFGIQLFTKQAEKNRNYSCLKSSGATLERDKEGVMHIDGNAVYTGKIIKIRVLPHALRVVVPEWFN